jgi:hypothetical protein
MIEYWNRKRKSLHTNITSKYSKLYTRSLKRSSSYTNAVLLDLPPENSQSQLAKYDSGNYYVRLPTQNPDDSITWHTPGAPFDFWVSWYADLFVFLKCKKQNTFANYITLNTHNNCNLYLHISLIYIIIQFWFYMTMTFTKQNPSYWKAFQDQVNFQLDDDEVRFVLDQHS